MFREAITHISDSNYAYAIDMQTLVIKLKAKKGDLEKVYLYYGDRYEPHKNVKMHLVEIPMVCSDDLYDYYECAFKPGVSKVCYYFKLLDKQGEEAILSQERFSKEPPDHRNKFYFYAYICRDDLYIKGDWWEKSVFYQIFVDRFDKDNKDDTWYELPKQQSIYGGNLKGIINKLDYLTDLGINCIYLTPIFQSISNHKYDISDYYKIDKNFGDEVIFKELVEKCHGKGIRIVLDAVFNHSSDELFAFKDVKEKGKESNYWDWYFMKDDGSYETFGKGIKSMPKLNTGNKEIIDHVCKVAKYWIEEFDIDGWRLDVANEISHVFWRKFREAVKSAREDAYIVGEAWDGAESYLIGDQFDSTMNYSFMYLALDYFAKEKITTEEFDEKIINLYMRYKKHTRNVLLNLLDSHDTSRFLYECEEDTEKLKMAIFFEMTCIGIPMLFYGDEAGVTGGEEPDCRRTINFQTMDKEVYELCKKMISIRKESKALCSGDYKTVYASKDVYAYKRSYEDEEIINIFNNGKKLQTINLKLENGNKAYDIFNEEELILQDKVITIEVQPKGKHVIKIIR